MTKILVTTTLFALFVTLMCATTEARRLIVHLQEDPLIETKAFKAIHKEVMMKRSLRNSLERNTPLGEFIANNKELRAQEKRVRSQQERLIAALPEGWKVAEIARENGKRQKAVTHIVSNAVVIDIGNSDVRKAKSTLILMPGVKSVEEEHEIMLNTFQSLGQIGATSVYETLGLSELDIGRGIKIAVTDNGNYVDTEMMNDEGFALPADIPADRGEISNVNNKLIVSRAYGTYNHSYQEPDESNHGIQ